MRAKERQTLFFVFLAAMVLLLGRGLLGGAPVGGMATLHIESQPIGARVFLDRAELGVTPLQVPVQAGDYYLRLELDGYRALERSIRLDKGVIWENVYELEPGWGRLTIVSRPAGAAVSIGGKTLEHKTPLLTPPLRATNHEIAIQHPDHQPAIREITVVADTTVALRHDFIKTSTHEVGAVRRDPVTGIDFAHVVGGCFVMGCSVDVALCDNDERPRRTVCLDDFWLAVTETTQGQLENIIPSSSRRAC